MSRFKNITGLQKFKDQPAAPAPPAFDVDKAHQLLRDGLSLVNSFYPAGAMEWLRDTRPDIPKQLKADWKAICAAIDAGDIVAVSSAVEVCIRHHRKAFEIFEGRPPVIEVQGDLLAA